MILQQKQAGWAILWMAALAASFSAPVFQIAFAVLAIGVIGMAHGASDLAIVRQGRQLFFLMSYGLAIVLCLIWWHTSPAVALPGFLLASAIHFGLEDAPDGGLAERIARGVSLIATPATLHQDEFRAILHGAGLAPTLPDTVTCSLALLGGVAAGGLLTVGFFSRNKKLITGTLALLILPPFVGFSLGFLILHALPQTEQRRDQLGYVRYTDYLRAIWPVLLGAIAIAGMAAFMLFPKGPDGFRSLFAALASLAIPHLLITPWFASRNRTV